MSKTKHTAAPWRRDGSWIHGAPDPSDIHDRGDIVARVVGHGHMSLTEEEANANLMTAAPQLLAVLMDCLPQLRWANIHGSRCPELIRDVELAIAQASSGKRRSELE